MEDDPYEDESCPDFEPAVQSTGPSEAVLCVQRMLGEQLDTNISLEQQASKSRSFTQAAATFRPFVEQASGQLSLEEFQALEREHEGLEKLRACGLSDEEIALKLEHEGRHLSNLLYPHKRHRSIADPVARLKRLKEVEGKIQRKKASLSSSQDAASSDNKETDNDLQGSAISSPKHPSLLSKKFVHPDDPINHLDTITAGLFGESSQGKQVRNVSQRSGNAVSLMAEPSGGCSPGCQGNGPHAAKKEWQANECSSKEKSVDGYQDGLRVKCALETCGRDSCRESITKRALHISKDGNLTNTPEQEIALEGCPEEEISNSAIGSQETGKISRQISGVQGKCMDEQDEDKKPRRLACIVSPLSREDLLHHHLSQDDIRRMERFANYSPGEPSKTQKWQLKQWHMPMVIP
ncbi:uncharacterized protein LOC110973794 isoform X2 [Acanthaster planci]|uniref:Uncharacterized protein LOC110973794 isoform X2 n=1 Tax=Acanthaster planci TaxID=133434 RepID=A0A8B7XIG1_ACAPL|nr:uncharacterized protein LOC110973794 isoform X2 [Acanthaster planci]